MHKNVPPAHFGYMATGIDDEVTLRANREGFQKFQLRPRRLVDVEHARHAHGTVRRDLRQPDRAGADRLQPRLPRGRRARRRARGPQGRRSPADAVDRRHDLDRGGDRGARPAGVVPALSDRTSGKWPRALAGAPRRPARNHRGHGRRAGAAELGDARAGCGAPTRATAARATALGLASFVSASPTSTASTSPASPAPAPPTSPGSSSSACATR